MQKKQKPEILSILEFTGKFANEKKARKYLEDRRWAKKRSCPHCGSTSTAEVKDEKPMPYRCKDCRKHFSVRTKTILSESPIPLHKWLLAIYLMTTARKGISSMQLAKELGVTQKTAWFLEHRIREAYATDDEPFGKEVEIDETFIGGKEKNKHKNKRLQFGRGGMGKQIVMGMLERNGRVRAFRIKGTTREILQTAIAQNIKTGSHLYTDCHSGYEGVKGYSHEVIRHSVGEYVRGQAHTNGIESFWALLKRGHYGTFHHMSVKHLHRYVNEFSTRHNVGHGTIANLNVAVDGMFGKRLTYKELKA
jgi:transposase-like protein